MKQAGINRGRWWLRGAGLAVVAALAAVWLVPFSTDPLSAFPAATLYCDREGRPLRVQLGPGDLDCRPDYRPQPGDWIVPAVVAAEDQRFWVHPGVDVIAIARAVGQNLRAGRVLSGASTLSTQVIRLLQPRPRTLAAKLVEAFRALQLERRLGKEEILAQYLNRAPFGSNLAGIEAASRRYFGKGPHDLSLAEASLLAGLPQSPSRLRPDRHPEQARRRQAYVLERMVALGQVSEADRLRALAQPLAIRPAAYPFDAPHFCELAAGSGAHGTVRTTLDAGLQDLAGRALRRQADALSAAGVRDGAVVIIDVPAAAVRALVGSPDFFARAAAGQVNAAAAPRAAGSTLKPFAFALALDRGLIGPRTMLADVPMAYRDYQPTDFDGRYHGPVAARDALILSLNMPALQLEDRLGQVRFYDTLRQLGLSTLRREPAHYGLGLVLGNAEVRLLDLANAYACLARGGIHQPVRFVEDAGAEPGQRLFSAEAAWLVAEALGGEERAMEATGHSADVRLPRLAWKTGTSSGCRDAWTIAYNPRYVVGVWVGRVDGAPADSLVGRRAAAPVVWDIFRRLHPDNDGPWYPRPAGLATRSVCAVSGCPPGPYCGAQVEETCIRGVTAAEVCPVHRRAGEDTWPAAVAAFLREQPRADGAAAAAPVHICAPADGTVYRQSDVLAADRQRIRLSATADAEAVHWYVDGRHLARLRPQEDLQWALQPGRHHIVCADESGRSHGVHILVE